MGDMFVDARLIDLAEGILNDPGYAYELARIQAENSVARGHLLAYNDEFVWRRLKARRTVGENSRLKVRCLGCGCVASMREWQVAATLDGTCADALRARLLDISEPDRLRFLQPCLGAAKAVGTLSALHAGVQDLAEYQAGYA